MELRSLQIANFRNITEMELVLPAGLVVIAGENAQGKSNLLEAVYLLALSKSYRASTDRELVSWATVESGGYAMVSGMVTRRRGEVEIRVGLECLVGQGVDAKVRKRVRINGVGRRASDLLGLLNAVFFSADDVEVPGCHAGPGEPGLCPGASAVSKGAAPAELPASEHSRWTREGGGIGILG
jgi:DNA replication and repair protein RecF